MFHHKYKEWKSLCDKVAEKKEAGHMAYTERQMEMWRLFGLTAYQAFRELRPSLLPEYAEVVDAVTP